MLGPSRRHARWCTNDRALVRQWRKLFPQLHSSDKVVTVPRCAGRAGFQMQVWRRQSSPTVAAVENSVEIPRVFLDKVVDIPLLCYDRCLVSGYRKLRILRSCSSSTRCGHPCDFAATCLAVGGATDSVHRLIWWTSQFAQRQFSTWLRCVIRVRIFWGTCVSHRCRWCRSRREFHSQVTRHRDCKLDW